MTRPWPFLIVSILLCAGSTAPHVRPVEARDIHRLVAEQRGRVVLLNFWATWCPPCVVEFPILVEMEESYRDKGLTILSVTADSLDRVDTDVLPFLEKYRPGFSVYIMKTEDPVEFIRSIDPDWEGTLPSTFFFDRRGKSSVKRYSMILREEMERILGSLLEEPEP